MKFTSNGRGGTTTSRQPTRRRSNSIAQPPLALPPGRVVPSSGRAIPSPLLPFATLVVFVMRVEYAHSLQLLSTAQSLLLKSPMTFAPSSIASPASSSPSSSSSSSSIDNVPAVLLSSASHRTSNGLYRPRHPSSIPDGFARLCRRAGGFAPRPLWDDVTNGLTHWYEQSNGGGWYLYYNHESRLWCLDDDDGRGVYLAHPEGSLLLPPTVGWITLT